jgi:hypothetical protein
MQADGESFTGPTVAQLLPKRLVNVICPPADFIN